MTENSAIFNARLGAGSFHPHRQAAPTAQDCLKRGNGQIGERPGRASPLSLRLQLQKRESPPPARSHIEELGMTFFGLFRREVDLSDAIPEAHAFLGEVRCGKSESEAANAVGASEEQVRLWKRHPGFREALKKAKTEFKPTGAAS